MANELPVSVIGTAGPVVTIDPPTPIPAPEAESVTPAAQVSETDLKARLAELEQRLSNKTQEADRLHKKVQAAEDAEKTEAQKLTERAEKAEREATLLRQNIQRQEIAAKVGLPPAFANRILGVTPEEMEADAKAMLASLPKQGPPHVGATAPTGGTLQTTAAQRSKRVWSTGVDPDAAMRGVRPD